MLKTNGASQCYLNFLLVKIYIPHSTYDSCKNDLPIFLKKKYSFCQMITLWRALWLIILSHSQVKGQL